MQQVQFCAMLSGEQGCAGDSSIGGTEKSVATTMRVKFCITLLLKRS